MISLFTQKLGQLLFVIVATGLIAFAIFSYAGDPVDAMLGDAATETERTELREQLGFNKPFYLRFGDFMIKAAQGDFGRSFRSNEEISTLLVERLPATLELVLVAAVTTLVLGVILGLYTGSHRNGWSRFILSASLLGVSMPTFMLGLLGIFLFSVHLGWLPASGRPGTVDVGWWTTSLLTLDGWRGILMPAMTLAVFNLGLYVRLVRAEVLEIRTTDYIKFARARGLSEADINRHHVLPNALSPLINVAALNIGTMIAFSLITESVFQWPGLGLMFVNAIGFSDFPVMAAYFMLVALMFVILNLIADILLVIVDPRLRRG